MDNQTRVLQLKMNMQSLKSKFWKLLKNNKPCEARKVKIEYEKVEMEIEMLK